MRSSPPVPQPAANWQPSPIARTISTCFDSMGLTISAASGLALAIRLGSTRRVVAVVRPDRDGATVRPSVVVEPPAHTALFCKEAFGPVVSIFRVPDMAAGGSRPSTRANSGSRRESSRAGWTACLRPSGGSRSCGSAQPRTELARRSDAVWGVKESGLGREGPRWAIEGMTEPRMLILLA